MKKDASEWEKAKREWGSRQMIAKVAEVPVR